MNEKTFLENDDQFIVSYELLYILQWIMTYEQEALKNLVHKAFVQGSQVQYSQHDDQFEKPENLQSSVLDFFSFLEHQVDHLAQTDSMPYTLQKNLHQTIGHIDPKLFDPALIQTTMMRTAEKAHLQKNDHVVKEIFLKELLKKWQPKKDKNKKHSLH